MACRGRMPPFRRLTQSATAFKPDSELNFTILAAVTGALALASAIVLCLSSYKLSLNTGSER
jgi:hypothetical protein